LAAKCYAGESVAIERLLLVDTETLTATVLSQGQAQKSFPDISLGRFGATRDKRRGDNKTPLGSYRVAWVELDGPFSAFIGIDYPSVADADRGLAAALITPSEHRAIVEAHAAGRVPPQTTALGGYLGIHGLGKADPDVHASYHWTRGCMALTNEQIAELLPWVSLGMPVEIR
jgi:murein L,D-transpeptidase YafK